MNPFPTRLMACLGAAAGLALVAPVCLGQVVNERVKGVATDGLAGDGLGCDVASDQGVIAVGACHDGDNGLDSGSAYLFNASTGAQLRKLTPSDGAPGDQFGYSIALRGGIVVVGAPYDVHNGVGSGSVYVFSASTGAQLAKLVPADGAANDWFGWSVAIDNGIVAVGAYGDDDQGTQSGSAYLFDAATGAQLDKLLPDVGGASQSFGISIAMEGSMVAVGSRAHFVPSVGFRLGTVWLFDAQSGNQLRTLTASNGTSTDQFAEDIDIDGGLVAVGAWGRSVFFDHSGAMYVFDAQTGDELHYIFPADGHDRDNFGVSIAISNGIVAVGAHQDGDNGFDAGSAYLFDATSGAQINKLLASDGVQFDYFGTSVDIDGDSIVIGAIGDADNGPDAGSLYIFGDATTAPCPTDIDGSGVTDLGDLNVVLFNFGNTVPSGTGGDCDANGTVDLVDLNLVLFSFGSAC
ncbi:MAG: hypothetical protein KDA20_05465 [Phycisphaerales bacterium]|nr:hypothetical protein [Phycisphaerales bacterium]